MRRYEQIKTPQNFINTHVHTDMEDKLFHKKGLLGHCRLCGESLAKERVTYSSLDHIDLLHQALGIDVRQDQDGLHPPRFCNRCYVALARKASITSLALFEWLAHSEPACRVYVRTSKWNAFTWHYCDTCILGL